MAMENRDIELCLCSKDPIFVEGVPVYPISLQEIAKIGYMRFNAGMRFLCLSADDIRLHSGHEIAEDEIFKYLFACCAESSELREMICLLLSRITHTKMNMLVHRQVFSCGAFDISRRNFRAIQDVIRLRNGLRNIDEEDDNPDNEAARRVLQRRKEERLKRKRAKAAEDGSDITISDLVSIMANGLGMTMHDIMQYDLYQFNDQFNRLKIMDDYEVSVQALLHGAKKEDVNLTHWITKIKHETE